MLAIPIERSTLTFALALALATLSASPSNCESRRLAANLPRRLSITETPISKYPAQTSHFSTLIHSAITLFSCPQHKSKAHPLVHVSLHSSMPAHYATSSLTRTTNTSPKPLSPRTAKAYIPPGKRPGWHQETSRLANDRGYNL